jgi:hypothetical protein
MFLAAAHSISRVLFCELLACGIEMVGHQFILCSDHSSSVRCFHQQPILNGARLWKAERIKPVFFDSTAVIFQAVQKLDVGYVVNMTSLNVQK